jgi:hypothetical protein
LFLERKTEHNWGKIEHCSPENYRYAEIYPDDYNRPIGIRQIGWTCPLTIASDTAATINANGQQYTNFREIKGSFSCSQVLSALNTDPPVNLSNGQLDVFVQTVAGS